MKDVKMYREYAADCTRIAQSMNVEDRETERLYLRWLRRGKIGLEKQNGARRRKAKGERGPVTAAIGTRTMSAAPEPVAPFEKIQISSAFLNIDDTFATPIYANII